MCKRLVCKNKKWISIGMIVAFNMLDSSIKFYIIQWCLEHLIEQFKFNTLFKK
jgi:hypothetical protein